MPKVKKLKTMEPSGSFSDYIDIGANAVNVDMANGNTLEQEISNIKGSAPTKLSQLENDKGFITSTVDNLTNYYKKTESYSKQEINDLIGGVSSLPVIVVESLPTADISSNTIYLVPKDQETEDIYNEYLYVNNKWEKIGTTAINLSNYYNKSEIDGKKFISNTGEGDSIGIGNSSGVSGNSIAIGAGTTANIANSIAIGAGAAATKENQFAIGSSTAPINEVSVETSSGVKTVAFSEDLPSYSDATSTQSGLMSSADKTKLDKLKEADSALNATSTAPVQNKVITQALGDINTLLDTINGEVV